MTKNKTLLADSGSTKTKWVLTDGKIIINEFTTAGINPYVTEFPKIVSTINSLNSTAFLNDLIVDIYFYGAGCTDKQTTDIMKEAFKQSALKSGSVFIGSDLLAAGRALFGRGKGVACILGTGSSSGLIDNGELIAEIPALGYVLGDEGGGVDIGKRLLVSVLKLDAPEDFNAAFYNEFKVSKKEILANIYFEPAPNRYLASFLPFVLKNIENPFCRKLVKESLESFISLNVLKYKDNREIPVGFVGSIAYYFKEILLEVLEGNKLMAGYMVQDPIPGLVAYHDLNLSQ